MRPPCNEKAPSGQGRGYGQPGGSTAPDGPEKLPERGPWWQRLLRWAQPWLCVVGLHQRVQNFGLHCWKCLDCGTLCWE